MDACLGAFMVHLKDHWTFNIRVAIIIHEVLTTPIKVLTNILKLTKSHDPPGRASAGRLPRALPVCARKTPL